MFLKSFISSAIRLRLPLRDQALLAALRSWNIGSEVVYPDDQNPSYLGDNPRTLTEY